MDEDTRLFLLLCDGLQPGDVQPPIGMFQAVLADRSGIQSVVQELSAVLKDANHDDLAYRFDVAWPALEKTLQEISTSPILKDRISPAIFIDNDHRPIGSGWRAYDECDGMHG
jgi:hypothetical protein